MKTSSAVAVGSLKTLVVIALAAVVLLFVAGLLYEMATDADRAMLRVLGLILAAVSGLCLGQATCDAEAREPRVRVETMIIAGVVTMYSAGMLNGWLLWGGE